MDKTYFRPREVKPFALSLHDLRNYVIGGKIDPFSESHHVWPMLTDYEGALYKEKSTQIKSHIINSGGAVVRQPEPLPEQINRMKGLFFICITVGINRNITSWTQKNHWDLTMALMT